MISTTGKYTILPRVSSLCIFFVFKQLQNDLKEKCVCFVVLWNLSAIVSQKLFHDDCVGFDVIDFVFGGTSSISCQSIDFSV